MLRKALIVSWLAVVMLIAPASVSAAVPPLVRPLDRPYAIPNGLDGRHLAIYGSHGRYYNASDSLWMWQRARVHTTVEDLFTSAFVQPYLVPMLENAGAVVLQPRERDTATEEYILPADSARGTSDWVRVVEGHSEHHFYHKATQHRHDTLCYPAAVDKPGHYALYTRYCTHEGSITRAHYIVRHCGQETRLEVNQQMCSDLWVYLGTFAFGDQADENAILVTSEGREGEVVTSASFKIGGGMGSIERGGVTSGGPRWTEAARYWLEYAGYPDSIWSQCSDTNDYRDDLFAHPRWINYLASGSRRIPNKRGANVPLDAALAFHSDAGVTYTDSVIGSLIIYCNKSVSGSRTYPDGRSRELSGRLAEQVNRELLRDIRAEWDTAWTDRGVKNARYAEARHSEVPTILLELLSHQNFADMRYGLDPRFRRAVSRSIYKGILRYLRGEDAVVQPLPVHALRCELTGDSTCHLSWLATPDTLEPGALPTGYVVYQRQDEQDWDNGTYTTEAELRLTLEAGHRYDFRVTAVNDGGASLPSAIVSAGRPAAADAKRVLVLDGFTRLAAPDTYPTADSLFAGFRPDSYGVADGYDRSYIGSQYETDRRLEWLSDDAPGYGASHADYAYRLTRGNTHDMSVQHGRELLAAGYAYCSMQAEALTEADTALWQDYAAVDIALGLQRSEAGDSLSQAFPPTLRRALSCCQRPILLSGAYLSHEASRPDVQAFARMVLGYKPRAPHATASGEVTLLSTLPQATLHVQQTPDEQLLVAEQVDGILPADKAGRVLVRYADTGIAAAVAVQRVDTTAAQGAEKRLIYAFPLESSPEFSDIYIQSINWLTHE